MAEKRSKTVDSSPARKARTRRAPAKKSSPTARGRGAKKAATAPRAQRSRRIVESSYVTRTRSILERRQRRAARLRADTRRELAGVWRDMRTDAEAHLDRTRSSLEGRARRWVDRARTTRVGAEVERVPGRALGVADGWLDRVGLVRKAKAAA